MPSLKKNFTFNTALSILNIIFPIVTFPYISRVLGPEGFGKIQFILNFAQYFALFAALGIPLYGIREIAKVRDDNEKLAKVSLEIIYINIVGSAVFAAIFILSIYFVPRLQADANLSVWASFIIIFCFANLDWFYSGIEDFKLIAYRSFLVKVLSIVLLFLFVKTSKDLLPYLLVCLFSILGNNIWNVLSFISKGNFYPVSGLEFKKHFRPLIVVFAANASISIYTMLDVVLVGFLSNDLAVGFYSAAIKLNKISIPVIISVGTVLIPRLAKSYSCGDIEQFKTLSLMSFTLICFIGVPIAFGLCIFAKEFVLVFSGLNFLPAVIAMQISSPLILLIGLGHLFGFQLLIPTGNDKYYLIAVIAGVISSILLNVILIPEYQQNGAAISTSFAEGIVTIISFMYVKKVLNLPFSFGYLLKCALATLPFCLVAFCLHRLDLLPIYILAIGIPVCVCVYLFSQFFIIKNSTVLGLVKRTNLLKKI